MDDDTGWDAILVQGWGPLVRAAVCARVEERLGSARGVLWVAATDPDAAPSGAVERMHDAIVEAIATETGAHLDDLGSQSSWATYDDVWAELGRRWREEEGGAGMEHVRAEAVDLVVAALQHLPRRAIEQAGAVLDGLQVRLVHVDDEARLDVEGLFRWLATDDTADEQVREAARRVVALVRAPPGTPT